MKRLILLLGILCMCFQCDPPAEHIVNHGAWVVKNTTAQNLIIRPGVNDLQPYYLAPGGSVRLYSNTCEILKMPDFQSLLDHSAWWGFADGNIYFEVLSHDGTPLAKWYYTDRDAPGRQFFNESSWTNTHSSGEREDEIKVTWCFEIAQEDIR